MSEATIQSGIQTAIRAMAEFADADVVINDWGIMDQASSNAPYVLIENSDTFESKQQTVSANTVWELPITLIERFTDWDTTLNNLRTRRQAIIDAINTGDIRTAGGLEAVDISSVRNDGGISYIYDAYIDPTDEPNALPTFISQRILLVAEEF